MTTTNQILHEVWLERDKQDAKWGEQNHPDGTSLSLKPYADEARAACDERAESGELTWLDILSEELGESACEVDPAKLRAELVQVAAVAVAWVEAIDRRSS